SGGGELVQIGHDFAVRAGGPKARALGDAEWGRRAAHFAASIPPRSTRARVDLWQLEMAPEEVEDAARERALHHRVGHHVREAGERQHLERLARAKECLA